jgi:hypothetical protein
MAHFRRADKKLSLHVKVIVILLTHIFYRNNLRSKRLYAKAGQKHPTHGPRNKILARYLMLSAIPAQLRFAFGARATNDAVNNVSEILQHPTLNRRLCYIFFERIIINIFPKNNVKELLSVLNSKSPRAHR